MLTGPDLGKAIRRALEAKRDATGLSLASMARQVFGVQPESVQGWMRTGAISKPNFEKLRGYVADVVGDSHWGADLAPVPSTPFPTETRALLEQLIAVAIVTNPVGLRHLLVDAQHYAECHPLRSPKKTNRAA